MPWSSDNTIPSMKGKSLELRKLFAKVANEALSKGRSEEEAVFAGLAAVRNAEKAKSKQIKKEAPQIPSHLKAILEASRVKQEGISKGSISPSEPISKSEPIRQAFLPKNALQIEKERTLVSAEFDENNRLVLVFDTGEKIVTNPAVSDEYIENHVIFEGGGGNQDLDSLTDVQVSSPANNQVLAYDAGQGIWKNVNPAAASGSDLSYMHDQSIASQLWVINHNLGKYPSVTVVDTAGDQVEGDVNYISVNQATVSFSSAFAGKAYLN